MSKKLDIDFTKLFAALAIVALAAWIGSAVTFPNITEWYANLNKPFFSPPNWLFGPVWTLLYVMMAVSLYIVWNSRYRHLLGKSRFRLSKQSAYVVYGAQLVLNVLWSVVFFGMHALWGGAAVIVLMWLAIAATIYLFRPISRVAAWLLVPYLLWVSFATLLNIAVAALNPGA